MCLTKLTCERILISINQKILISSSSYRHYHITTELKDQVSTRADKSRQEHARLYDRGSVIKTNSSSGENSAFASRHTGVKVWPTTMCSNPVFTVNPHGAAWRVLSQQRSLAHSLVFFLREAAQHDGDDDALHRRLRVQLSQQWKEQSSSLQQRHTSQLHNPAM